MSTKIHATCDALGNPTGFYLTAGQCCDLDGSDVLLEELDDDVEAVLGDKAYDADERVHQRLKAKGCVAVIPPKSNRKSPRSYDKHLYKGERAEFCVSGLESRVMRRPPYGQRQANEQSSR